MTAAAHLESPEYKKCTKLSYQAYKIGCYVAPQNGNWYNPTPPTIFWLRRHNTFEIIVEGTLEQIEERVARYCKLKAFL